METKTCPKCGKTYPIGNFSWVGGVEICLGCAAKAQPERMVAAEYAKAHPDGTMTVKFTPFTGKAGIDERDVDD